MKIAKIFQGDPGNQKGQFNNIIERTKRLKSIEKKVDCYMIRVQRSWIFRLLKKEPLLNFSKEEFTEIQGVVFTNLWIKMTLLDYLFTFRLKRKLAIANRQLKKYSSIFSNYDVLSVHTYEAVTLAVDVKNKYGTPFVSTWHGSDINYRAFSNSKLKRDTSALLDAASHNFFVSESLKRKALTITPKPNKSILYTGPAEFFYAYPKEKKIELKNKFLLKGKYAVGFIGNFVHVKNVLVLPEIFYEIQNKLPEVSFVLVGSGEQEGALRSKIQALDVQNVYFLGKLSPQKIPDILNCLDLLILPSLNEGLPRVTLEAQACGIPVLGSNRGGIPEAIGKDNTFELNENFVGNISQKAVEVLANGLKTELPSIFSWQQALEIEQQVHLKSSLNKTVI